MARNNPLSLGRDLAIDLGTANTLIYVRGQGIVLNEPSVVAININDGRPVAVGLEAKRMMGRTPDHIKAIRPLKDGVIADFEVCEKMLRYFIQKVHASRVEQAAHGHLRAVGHHRRRAARRAGRRRVRRRPQAGAHHRRADGRGDRRRPAGARAVSGNMIVDIGGGTTEVAVISLGGIVTAQSVRVAGDELDDAVLQYVKKEFSLAIGDRTAEEIKIQMGSAWPLDEELTADIRGRDLISGLPRTIQLTTEQVREALAEPVVCHRRRREDHARQDAARAGRRHHGAGHHDHRWRRAARPGSTSGSPHETGMPIRHRRRAAVQRGHRLRPGAREHRRDAGADVARRRRLSTGGAVAMFSSLSRRTGDPARRAHVRPADHARPARQPGHRPQPVPCSATRHAARSTPPPRLSPCPIERAWHGITDYDDLRARERSAARPDRAQKGNDVEARSAILEYRELLKLQPARRRSSTYDTRRRAGGRRRRRATSRTRSRSMSARNRGVARRHAGHRRRRPGRARSPRCSPTAASCCCSPTPSISVPGAGARRGRRRRRPPRRPPAAPRCRASPSATSTSSTTSTTTTTATAQLPTTRAAPTPPIATTDPTHRSTRRPPAPRLHRARGDPRDRRCSRARAPRRPMLLALHRRHPLVGHQRARSAPSSTPPAATTASPRRASRSASSPT